MQDEPAGRSGPEKPCLTVGAIGQTDHGVTTLTAALAARQAHHNRLDGCPTYDDLTRGGVVARRLKTITTQPAYVEYETPKRRYLHIDCPGDVGRPKETAAVLARMAGAILVVAADVGPQIGTREYLALARGLGVPSVVIFLNKVDQVDDPRLLDLVEVEVRRLLHRFDFRGDDAPVVRGNALAAMLSRGADDWACWCIDELVWAIDTTVGWRSDVAGPGTAGPRTRFEADAGLLTPREGGPEAPLFSGCRQQFYFRAGDAPGTVELPQGVAMCLPGEEIRMAVELRPDPPLAFEEGQGFAFRDAGRTVGFGTVTRTIKSWGA